jgi:PPIC-type PPIASE domain
MPSVACGSGSVGTSAGRADALEFLITTTWLAKLLDDLGVRPSAGGGESNAGQLASVLRAHAPAASVVELNQRLLASVAARLRRRVNAIAHRQMVAYYGQNAADFVGPEERDAEVIRTTTLPTADKAKREIEAGDRFAEVAARVTVDATGKTNGGLVPAIVRSQEDPPLAKAVFSARLHALTGPVMLEPHRYYLFRIKTIRPARDTTLEEFEASALGRYLRAAMARLASEWIAKLTASTHCRKGYVVEGCRQFAGAAGAGS